jgi:hypothetical protein
MMRYAPTYTTMCTSQICTVLKGATQHKRRLPAGSIFVLQPHAATIQKLQPQKVPALKVQAGKLATAVYTGLKSMPAQAENATYTVVGQAQLPDAYRHDTNRQTAAAADQHSSSTRQIPKDACLRRTAQHLALLF